MATTATPDLPGNDTAGPGVVVWVGLAVVLLAAAALSFEALRALAVAVKVPGYLAWLLPVAVDAGASVSCATWLSHRVHDDAARFARSMTWSLLVITVAGNAAQLGMQANEVDPPWWVAVAVGAIPPAVMGGVVHLAVLVSRAGRTAGPAADEHGGLAAVSPAALPVSPTYREDSPQPGESVGDPAQSVLQAGREIPLGEVFTEPGEQGFPGSPTPSPAAGEGVGEPGEGVGEPVSGRAAELLAAGAGRRRISRELSITEYEARQLLARGRNGEAT